MKQKQSASRRIESNFNNNVIVEFHTHLFRKMRKQMMNQAKPLA